jgi:aldehyde:ferredoxin oxidoreductase
MFGWRGQFLRVNLTTGAISNETPDPTIFKDYLGGRGLAVYLAIKDAANKLVFMTGPLTGTLAPNGGRYTVAAKTGAEKAVAASISGSFGPELKFARLDGIVVEGKSSAPVYLWIKDGDAELRSAAHLSGKSVSQITEALLAETDRKSAVSCIGPAGEAGADNAVLATDSISAAGANGIGAVMGEMNLKAVVVRGTLGFRVSKIKDFSKIAQELRAGMTPIAARGSMIANCALVADGLEWNKPSPDFKPARPHGCFGCSTSFSSFDSEEGKRLPLTASTGQGGFDNRLDEYRNSIDGGAGFINAQDQVIDRGPCIVGGHPIVPRLLSGDQASQDILAVLDSAGLCPFLAAGIANSMIAELLSSATGVKFSEDEIIQIGRRISELVRQSG